jgi:hypothetical protein
MGFRLCDDAFDILVLCGASLYALGLGLPSPVLIRKMIRMDLIGRSQLARPATSKFKHALPFPVSYHVPANLHSTSLCLQVDPTTATQPSMLVLGGSRAVILHEDGPLTLHPCCPSDPSNGRITSGNGSVITGSSADGPSVSRICGTQRGIDESMAVMDGVFKVVIYNVAYDPLICCKIRCEILQGFYEHLPQNLCFP